MAWKEGVQGPCLDLVHINRVIGKTSVLLRLGGSLLGSLSILAFFKLETLDQGLIKYRPKKIQHEVLCTSCSRLGDYRARISCSSTLLATSTGASVELTRIEGQPKPVHEGGQRRQGQHAPRTLHRMPL